MVISPGKGGGSAAVRPGKPCSTDALKAVALEIHRSGLKIAFFGRKDHFDRIGQSGWGVPIRDKAFRGLNGA
jgi:hypothetical protein